MAEHDPAPETRAPRRRSALLAAILGWAVPGLGHVYAGRPRKGLFYAVLLLGAFGAGLWLSGARSVNLDRDPYWFLAQVFLGVPTFLTLVTTRGLEVTERLHAFDAGMLYVSIAALLNVVAIADAVGIVDADRRDAREAARRAAAAALPPGDLPDDATDPSSPPMAPPPAPPTLPYERLGEVPPETPPSPPSPPSLPSPPSQEGTTR